MGSSGWSALAVSLAWSVQAVAAPAIKTVEDPPAARLSLEYALSFRSDSQQIDQVSVSASGLAPSHLRFSGAWFFGKVIGASLDLAFERFDLAGNDLSGQAVTLPSTSLDLSGALALRTRPSRNVFIEGDLGYGWGRVPVVQATPPSLAAFGLSRHGPVVAVHAGLDEGLVTPQLHVRAVPYAMGEAPSGSVTGWQVDAGAEIGVSGFEVAGLRLTPLAGYELSLVRLKGEGSSDFQQTAHHVRLGLRAVVPGEVHHILPHGPGTLRGRVLADGRPFPGASIEVAGRALVSDASGGFVAEQVGPGTLAIRVRAGGFRVLEQKVEVAPEDEALVELTLLHPTGPGRIKGLVRSGHAGAPGVALKGAKIETGTVSAVSGDDGSFVLDQVGPGPVQLKLTAAGHKSGEEVVSVPPEGEVAAELTLQKVTQRAPATLRGQVRSLAGVPLRAALKVVEAKVSGRTAEDGSFRFSVPGGRYQVVIEVPGYVTQTKVVEVADGDQAIFNIDMQQKR